MIQCVAWMAEFLPNSKPMPDVCFLTGGTAQYTQSNFPGRVRVHELPFEIQNSIGKFAAPSLIALADSLVCGTLRTRQLREFVQDAFPDKLLIEHPIQLLRAILFGPCSSGLFGLEPLD
jgi:hypothetical protein